MVLTSSVHLSLYPFAHPTTIFCTNSSEIYNVSNVQAKFAAKVIKFKSYCLGRGGCCHLLHNVKIDVITQCYKSVNH